LRRPVNLCATGPYKQTMVTRFPVACLNLALISVAE
jgi:hypothetical protein